MSGSVVDNIKTGSSVEIQFDSEKPSLRTMVEKGVENGRFRVLAPIVGGVVYLFGGYPSVKVIYTTRAMGVPVSVFEVKCNIVSKLKVDGIPVIELEVVSQPEATQRRRAFRVEIYGTTYYKDLNNLEGDVKMLKTRDISLLGMLALTDSKLYSTDKVRIWWNFDVDEPLREDMEFANRAFAIEEMLKSEDFDLDPEEISAIKADSDKYFFIDANVVSSQYDKETRKYETRFSFDPIPEKNSKAILKFLYRCQAEQLKSDPEIADRIDDFFASYTVEDPFPRYIPVLTLIASAIGVVSVFLTLLAKPREVGIMAGLLGVDKHVSGWNMGNLYWALGLIIISIVIELVALIVKIPFVKSGKKEFKPVWVIFIAVFFVVFIYLVYVIQTLNA